MIIEQITNVVYWVIGIKFAIIVLWLAIIPKQNGNRRKRRADKDCL